MEILVIAMLLGIIPSMIASKKGGSAFGWWLFGSLLFIIALPLALLKRDTTAERETGGPVRITPAPPARRADNEQLLAKIEKLGEWLESGRITKTQHDTLLERLMADADSQQNY